MTKSEDMAVGRGQELLGHPDVNTTMVCTHVLNRGRAVRCPADRMPTP